MKINPNCFELLKDFFTAEDQYKLLKECFDLTEDDWEKAFQLIADFGCSEEYNEQFKRYYQGWETNPSNFFNPKEWVDELEAELKRDKSDNTKEDIDWEITALFYDEWYESFSEIQNSLMQVIESIEIEVSHQVEQLKALGINLKICFDDFIDKEDFLAKALKINQNSNSYQPT